MYIHMAHKEAQRRHHWQPRRPPGGRNHGGGKGQVVKEGGVRRYLLALPHSSQVCEQWVGSWWSQEAPHVRALQHLVKGGVQLGGRDCSSSSKGWQIWREGLQATGQVRRRSAGCAHTPKA